MSNCRFCDLEMTHSGSDTWLACELLLDPPPAQEDNEYRCGGWWVAGCAVILPSASNTQLPHL